MIARPEYPDTARGMMLPFVPPGAKTLLDVGCNEGGFGRALKATRDIEVWGIEPSADAARIAAQRLDHVLAVPFTSDVPVPRGYFDVVSFNDVLEHLENPWSALATAAQLLSERGVVIAAIPNLRHIETLEHIIFERDFRYEEQGIRDRTHLRFFTRKSAIRLFEHSGYSVLTVQGVNEAWWRPDLSRRLLFRFFGRWLEDTKYLQYAVVARPFPDAPGAAQRA